MTFLSKKTKGDNCCSEDIFIPAPVKQQNLFIIRTDKRKIESCGMSFKADSREHTQLPDLTDMEFRSGECGANTPRGRKSRGVMFHSKRESAFVLMAPQQTSRDGHVSRFWTKCSVRGPLFQSCVPLNPLQLRLPPQSSYKEESSPRGSVLSSTVYSTPRVPAKCIRGFALFSVCSKTKNCPSAM